MKRYLDTLSWRSLFCRRGIVWGNVRAGEELEVVSQMPQEGVILSDGVEADYLSFDSGASICVAEEKARLVAG